MTHFAAFLGLAALIVITPGADMALVTKNGLLRGRPAALATALGINCGVAVWALASALGLAAVLRASETAFLAVKVLGAAYLLWLGLRTIRGAGHAAATRARAGRPFVQGLLSNLFNPKIAVFFTSFIPQFVSPAHSSAWRLLALGLVFNAMRLVWLVSYACVVGKAGGVLRRPRIRAALDRLTGLVVVGFGVRLAAEHR